MPLLLAAAWWSPRATGRLPISSDSRWSRVAFQADVIDEGLEGASRICWQPGEPHEHVTAVGWGGEPQAHRPPGAGDVRGGRHGCQCGLGSDADLQAGAARAAEGDPGGGDRDWTAHVRSRPGPGYRFPKRA